jgi:hypothetical protein
MENCGSGRRAPEMEYLSLWELCYGNLELYKKALERAPLSVEASLGNLGEGSYARGLCVEEGSGMGVSTYRSPIGEPVERGSIYWKLRKLAEGGL